MSGVSGPGFNLVELLQELKSNNPQLIQARHTYLSAKSVPPQLAAPNNPQLGFIWSNIPKGFPAAVNRATGNAYSVTQQIPFPGKKSLAAEIADRQAESLNAQSDALYLQLYAQLSTTYYQAISLQKQIDVLKLTIARLEQVKQITRVRYANNAAAYADYLNAQVSQSSAQNDLFAAQRQYDTTVQTLNTLIGKEPSFPLELRAEDDAVRLPGEPLPELENQALRQHRPSGPRPSCSMPPARAWPWRARVTCPTSRSSPPSTATTRLMACAPAATSSNWTSSSRSGSSPRRSTR